MRVASLQKAGKWGKGYFHKENQDRVIMKISFYEDMSLFAVCDGHGSDGHNVA